MPRHDLTRVVVLSAVVLAAACSRRLQADDAGVSITRDAGVPDTVVVVDGRAAEAGTTDAPWASDVPSATDVPGAVDVPPPADGPPATDAPSRSCPLPGPSTGQSCSDRAPGTLCYYGDAEPSGCTTRCECRGANWICDRPCSVGQCPVSLPVNAYLCSMPTLRCTYATGCAPREYMCMAFEVGAPSTWVCVANCGPCDAGADGPLDGGGDVVADAARDAIADGGGDGGSGVPCGSGLTCFGTDICVTLNLCGGPVDCRQMPDGGECPAGTKLYPDCPGGRPGCIPDCPGPSYRCVPPPAACGAALSCACVTADVCPFTSCISAQGRNVFCANS